MDVRLLGTHGSGRGQPLAPSPLISPFAPLGRHYGPSAPLDPHARGGACPHALTPGASPGNIGPHLCTDPVDSARRPSVCSARIGALPQPFAYAEPLATGSFGTVHFLEGACR